MPAYDFRCTSCGSVFEVVRPAGEKAAPPCPGCGCETKRVFTPVGVHFKGAGFYSTDSKGTPPAPGGDAPATKPAAEGGSCPAGGGGSCAGCPAVAE